MMKMAIPAGTVVTCPRCSLEIAELMEDIPRGSTVAAEKFLEINGIVRAGVAPICPQCRELWLFNGYIHTEKGWLPNPPKGL